MTDYSELVDELLASADVVADAWEIADVAQLDTPDLSLAIQTLTNAAEALRACERALATAAGAGETCVQVVVAADELESHPT